MAKHPLELVLCHTGHAELVDGNGDVIWSSDADEDFKEEISDEFLNEDDVDDVLDYLGERKILTSDEVSKFEDETFEVTEESLGDDADKDDEDVIADDDGDEY